MSAAIAAGVISAGTGLLGAFSGNQGSFVGRAQQAQAAANNQARTDLTNYTQKANSYLQPYANLGTSAANELAWQMGFEQPAGGNQAFAADVPTTFRPGGTNDPLWEKIITDFNNQHRARFGIDMNRPWNADADSQAQYQALVQKYLSQKQSTPQALYQGQGQRGSLMANFTPEDYRNDPLYTPMVNSLEDLQATPGYQFELQQGLQTLNNSAAAKGSLLSGAQLKGLTDYSQNVASTKYQDAWNRAQTAYQRAFDNYNTNRTTKFNMLSGMTGQGQNAATQQATNTSNIGQSLAGITQNQGSQNANYALMSGQNRANMNTSIGNALTSGMGAYLGVSNQNKLSDLLSGYNPNLVTANNGIQNNASNWADMNSMGFQSMRNL